MNLVNEILFNCFFGSDLSAMDNVQLIFGTNNLKRMHSLRHFNDFWFPMITKSDESQQWNTSKCVGTKSESDQHLESKTEPIQICMSRKLFLPLPSEENYYYCWMHFHHKIFLLRVSTFRVLQSFFQHFLLADQFINSRNCYIQSFRCTLLCFI